MVKPNDDLEDEEHEEETDFEEESEFELENEEEPEEEESEFELENEEEEEESGFENEEEEEPEEEEEGAAEEETAAAAPAKQAAPLAEGTKPAAPQDIPLDIVVEVGRMQMPIKTLMELKPGNLLDLNIHPEKGVDLVVNGSRIGRGELLQIGDRLGIRILEVG